MKKASWVNHVISLDRQSKTRNYLKNVTLTLLNMNRGNWNWFRLETIINIIEIKSASWFHHIPNLCREYKHRNYLKHVTFTLLNTNRCKWKWFRLETIISNIEMKKASWFNHILSSGRKYKHRNYLKNVTFSYLTRTE